MAYTKTVISDQPLYLTVFTYTADDDRKVLQDISNEGVISAGDFAVTFSSGLTFAFAAGIAFVDGKNVADQGTYRVRAGSGGTIAVGAGHATNPRLDQIVLRVLDDAHDGSGANEPRIEVIPGTPTAGATLDNRLGATNLSGSLDENSKSLILLADVLVPAGAGSVTSANLRDKRTRASLSLLLGDNSVPTAAIVAAAVTGPKIATGAVTDTHITGPIDEAKIAPGSNGQQLVTSGGTVQWATPGAVSDPTPPGTIHDYGGDTAPTGYLMCDGSAVSRTTYAALFAVIGTKFGAGNGSTTFNLPPKGRIYINRDSADTDLDTVGEMGGGKTVSITTGNLPPHTHGVGSYAVGSHTHNAGTLAMADHDHTVQAHSHTIPAKNVSAPTPTSGGTIENFWADGTSAENTGTQAAFNTDTMTTTTINGATAGATASVTGVSGSAGSGTAMNVMNPFVVVNKIIKT